jgi:hypothetical protein
MHTTRPGDAPVMTKPFAPMLEAIGDEMTLVAMC